MRAKSARAARQHRQRVARLKATTHGPERCQWPAGCTSEAHDAHESLTRARGGDPTDPDWLLCRTHHDWVDSHPAEALAMGLLAPSLPARPVRRTQLVAQTCTLPPMAKQPLSLRVTDQARQWIDAEAKRGGVTTALVVRAMLSVATSHASEVRAKITQLRDA